MEHQHSDYRDWKLCVTPDGPSEKRWFIGHGVRLARPHEAILTQASTGAAALDGLHRQVDVIEDAASG